LEYGHDPGPKADLLTSREVSIILRLPVRLLADWRYKGQHLWFYKFGGKVRYDWKDIENFLVKNRHQIDPDQELSESAARALARNLREVRTYLAAHPDLEIAAFMKAALGRR